MARRGENIRKRRDGRWEGRYVIYDIRQECQRVRSVYAKSYGEVKEKLSEAKHEMEMELAYREKGSTLLFREVAREWLNEMEQSRKYATYRKYLSVYNIYLDQELGNLPVIELEPEMLKEAARTGGLSGSMQNSVSCVLNQILIYTAEHYHVGPAGYTGNRRPNGSRPTEVLNHTEQARLLRCLYEKMDVYKLGIIICISTGLRLGEICALKWDDIDMECRLLHVNATVQRIAVEGNASRTVLLEGAPKSAFSRREIPLSDELCELLRPYYGTGRYVINRNRPTEPRTYQNRFHKYLTEAGIEARNFHILRHTFATNCIANGADIKSLSEILGHSDIKITLNRYVHPGLETKRQHLNSLSAVYGQYLGREACAAL